MRQCEHSGSLNEQGTTSIVLVAVIAALIALLTSVLIFQQSATQFRRAQTGLDLAALAGAGALNNGGDSPCELAKTVMAENSELLGGAQCTIVGADLKLSATVTSVLRSKHLVSVAGPDSNL